MQKTMLSVDKKRARVIAVLPAYNAEKTLAATLEDIHRDWVDEIILVDDASSDHTAEVAQELGLNPIVHARNVGYGGNQKTCYREALSRGADAVVMVHPDHQYDPHAIPELIQPILRGDADAVFGSRMMTRGSAIRGGMPLWKYVANIALTKIANAVLDLRLTEYHSGFRSYSRAYLETVPFENNSNDFVFDTEIIVQGLAAGFRFKEIPISTRYFKEASSVGIRRSIVYGVSILRTLTLWKLHQWGVRKDPRFIPKRGTAGVIESEILSTKHETNSNTPNSNVPHRSSST